MKEVFITIFLFLCLTGIGNVSFSQPGGEVPFGEFATPLDGAVVRSSIPVTGWALDDKGVASVKIYRESEDGSTLVYIGNAVFVEGARPDVEEAYPGYPNNSAAGWGYMMLSNFLPNGGNGTFTLHAIAADTDGNSVTLGSKRIICDNANAVKPFGAIDTPTQGGTASGSNYRCQGWVLTPLPNNVPVDGSTINVIIDGEKVGNVTYNIYRSDIAGLFPGYANSNGAMAYFDFDTTAYANGVHTIQWTATDNAGNTDGIGSRYFSINNEETPIYADYYVSKNGNDNNDGKSMDNAFRTISHAFEVVQPGEIIQVLAGTYDEEILLENSGNSSASITLKGEADATILDGQRVRSLGIWCENCTNLIFENLEIRNYTDIGIGALYSSAITMRDLTVHNNGFAVQLTGWELEGYGIHVDVCENVLIENNDVYQNGPNPQIDILMGTGINTFECTDCTIRSNQCYENIGGGILVEDGVNVLVEGNNVYNNDLDASSDEWWDGGLWVDGGHDIIIRNNTFTGNLGPGIELSDEDFQNPYGYILENNTSTGNYYGIFIWNFGTNDWPPDNIIKRSGNQFTGNSRKNIWITAWY
ncbi:MAG: right-handed parallel beta-helix repeat-containing protein [Candidatus Aminicenantes bacterium]|nr:MAG: right-handed parallel beta-helix repeat-containing protein [Candidatus Aminicenantes bacterium]